MALNDKRSWRQMASQLAASHRGLECMEDGQQSAWRATQLRSELSKQSITANGMKDNHHYCRQIYNCGAGVRYCYSWWVVSRRAPWTRRMARNCPLYPPTARRSPLKRVADSIDRSHSSKVAIFEVRFGSGYLSTDICLLFATECITFTIGADKNFVFE